MLWFDLAIVEAAGTIQYVRSLREQKASVDAVPALSRLRCLVVDTDEN